MSKSEIIEMQKAIHKNAVKKGFWDKSHQQNIPEKLALIHSEVSEALEDYRGDDDKMQLCRRKDGKPCGFPIELADIIIRCLDLAEYFGYDMDTMIRIKVGYNSTREYMHGGKRC